MIWDKLVDRCLLFTDAPGGLLKELLKEAEVELSDKLQIFESIYKITIPSTLYGGGVQSHNNTTEHNYFKLPSNYIQDIGVTHKGTRLRKMTEDEIHRKTTGQSYSGTPTAYSISGDYIVFNSTPTSGDNFILHYKARMTSQTSDKVLTMLYYDNTTKKVWLDTDLGSLGNSKRLYFESQFKVLADGSSAAGSLSAGMPDIFYSSSVANPGIVGGPVPTRIASSYKLTDNGTDASGWAASNSLSGDEWTNANGALVTMVNYRATAPLIPEQFHTDLCDYAIAIANAKSSPETYNQYWTKWMVNMDNLINEAADRDLIFSVREEI